MILVQACKEMAPTRKHQTESDSWKFKPNTSLKVRRLDLIMKKEKKCRLDISYIYLVSNVKDIEKGKIFIINDKNMWKTNVSAIKTGSETMPVEVRSEKL